MSLDDIVDPKTGDLRVSISDAMREAAVPVVQAYDAFMLRTHGNQSAMLRHTPQKVNYEGALKAFKEATYEANPYLDPNAMRKDDGTPMYTQRLDMERASGKVLNDLLCDVATEHKTAKPRPFDETVRRL
jgi:hypothetical protein